MMNWFNKIIEEFNEFDKLLNYTMGLIEKLGDDYQQRSDGFEMTKNQLKNYQGKKSLVEQIKDKNDDLLKMAKKYTGDMQILARFEEHDSEDILREIKAIIREFVGNGKNIYTEEVEQNILKRRSKFMLKAAHKTNAIGIWKVQQIHIKNMREIDLEKGEKYEHYKLVDKKEYDEDIALWIESDK